MKTRYWHTIRKSLGLNKIIHLTAITATFGYSTVLSHGALFDFSYTFRDGTEIHGTLRGTPEAGGTVDNVSVIDGFLNGFSLTGPVYADHFVFTSGGGSHISGVPNSAIVSTDISKNNLDFIWGIPAPGHDFVTFSMKSFYYNDVMLQTPGVIHADMPTAIQSNWRLTPVPETNTAIVNVMGFGFVLGLSILKRRVQLLSK